eukprot:scaffold73484_cov30-Cyclotella_meneghiniana.AAC.2
MSLGQYMLFTAAGLFQCLIISIMNCQRELAFKFIVYNGHHKSGLAFKFIVYNGHHKLTFKSQMGTNLVYGTLLFTPRLYEFGAVHAIHSSWTVPMSHYKYNEWSEWVGIQIHWLQWSPQADF